MLKKIEAWFRWPWTIANIYNVVEERPQFVVFRLKYVTLYFISITWTALCLQKKDIVQKWPKTSDYLKLWCGMTTGGFVLVRSIIIARRKQNLHCSAHDFIMMYQLDWPWITNQWSRFCEVEWHANLPCITIKFE